VSSHCLCLYRSHLGKVILKVQLLSKMTERYGNDTKSWQKSQNLKKISKKSLRRLRNWFILVIV